MRTRVCAVVFVVFLLSATAAAAQPLPSPLSPEAVRVMDAHPELDGARAVGAGIVLTGVFLHDCASSAMILDLAVVIIEPGDYWLNTVVTANGSTYMHARSEWLIGSGHFLRSLSGDATGGTINANFPLPSNTPISVDMLLSEGGRPLWFTELTITDCDGTPATTSGAFSSVVRIVNKNPIFQPDPANPSRAAKWTTEGKVTYSCGGSGCVEKMTGKTDNPARLKQTAKQKQPLPSHARLGTVVVADLAQLTAGWMHLMISPEDEGTAFTASYYFDAPLYPVDEMVHMPVAEIEADVSKYTILLSLDDSDSRAGAAGKAKIKAFYMYVVIPPNN